jgi:SSS family solute:Na+ symporter
MAQNFWTAIASWTTCFTVTVLVSLATRRTRTDGELRGLVYGLTVRSPLGHLPWYRRPLPLGALILGAAAALNLVFA